ncbi:hypothetical protein [Roseiflexus sp.]
MFGERWNVERADHLVAQSGKLLHDVAGEQHTFAILAQALND